MTDPFARLTDQIIRFKWIVIGSWVAVIAVAALLLAPHATEVLQGGSLVIPGSESDRADGLLRTKLDASSQNTAIVVIQSGDLTVDSPAFKAQVTQAAQLLGQMKGVRAVRTYYSGGGAAFASRDGHTTLITASLEGDEQAQQAVIPDLRKALASLNLQHWVTGFAAASYDSLGASEEDAHLAELIFLPVLFVLLLLVFRTLTAALIPLALGGLTVVLSQGLLYPLGILIPTSVFALNTGSMIGLGLCIDYSLIIVTRYREEVLDGQTPHDALLIAMATAGRSITYSGITVILAMSAMTALLWPIVMVRSISLSVALAAVIALAFALTLLPASLHLLGRHIESLAVLPRAKRPKPGELGFWYRLSDLIMARPAVWLVAGLAILVVLAAPLRTIVLGGPGIPAGVESSNGADTVSRAFGPGQLAPVQIVIQTSSQNGIWTPSMLGAIDDLTTELAADNRVAGVDSLRTALNSQPREAFTNLTPDKLGTAPGSLGNFVDAAGDTTTLFVYSKDREFDASTESLLTDIRDRILPSTAGLKNAKALAGGETAIFRDYETGLYARFPLIAAVVAALIFVVLMMFFQSIFLPLKAVILNLVSIAATFGDSRRRLLLAWLRCRLRGVKIDLRALAKDLLRLHILRRTMLDGADGGDRFSARIHCDSGGERIRIESVELGSEAASQDARRWAIDSGRPTEILWDHSRIGTGLRCKLGPRAIVVSMGPDGTYEFHALVMIARYAPAAVWTVFRHLATADRTRRGAVGA